MQALPVRRAAWRACLGALATACGAGLAPAPALAAAPATGPGPAAGVAGGPITLHYQERPPYSSTAGDGHVQGLLANPAARACQKAQLACTWARTPGQRQLALIQMGQGWDCGLGWFRNAEREALGRFSVALYQNRPYMALVRRGTPWEPQRSLSTLLADATLPLLVKDGYSYGAQLDALIAQHAGQVRRTSAESQQMARMIEAGRAGWMFVAPEEAEVLLAEPGPGGTQAQLQLHPLPGVPAGQTRHLYCNKAVPESVMERLNRALAER